MLRGCDHAVHVQAELRGRMRHFIVEFNADGDVLRIKERKPKERPQLGVYDASWWVASSHVLGISNSTGPKRIIAAARAKLTAFNDAP